MLRYTDEKRCLDLKQRHLQIEHQKVSYSRMLLRKSTKYTGTMSAQYEKQLTNGDSGIIADIADGICVQVDGRRIILPKKAAKKLKLGYACTVHQAQGESIPIVIVILGLESKGMLSNELVYVAVSRAAKQCVVIAEREWREDGGLSSKNAYDIAIEKYASSHRVTGLTERIKQAVKE